MIIITGGSGFLGRHVAASIPEARAVSSQDLDLTDSSAVMSAFHDWRPDAVIHLAAKVGGILANTTQGADFLIDNLRIDGNVLAAVRSLQPEHLITMLSTCIYPNRLADDHYPMTEEMIELGEAPVWNAPYAAAKRALLHGTRALHSQYGVPYSGFVPANMYGPEDHFGEPGAHFLADAVDKIERARLEGADRVEFFGSGVAMRQVVYGPDMATLIKTVLERGPINAFVNVASRDQRSIRDLAHEVASAAGYEGEVRFRGDGPDGQLRKDVSPELLARLVPDWIGIETPLDQGLGETVAWYRTRTSESGGVR